MAPAINLKILLMGYMSGGGGSSGASLLKRYLFFFFLQCLNILECTCD